MNPGSLTHAWPRRRGFRTMLVAVLALSALLTWVLVMHSGAQAPMMTVSSHGALSSHDALSEAPDAHGATAVAADAVVTATASVTADAALVSTSSRTSPGDTPCGAGCTPDCAMMTALCALLVTLLGLVHLAVAPALHRPLVEARRQVMLFCAEAGIPAHRPDLNALSISRT